MTIHKTDMKAVTQSAEAILSTPLPTAPASAGHLADVKARGKLVVGISDAIPPFTFRRSGGESVGYDVDLLRGVADRIGVKLEMVSLAETERISALQQGKVDLVASTFTRTPERERVIDFSVNIFYSPQVIIVDKASALTSVKQLLFQLEKPFRIEREDVCHVRVTDLRRLHFLECCGMLIACRMGVEEATEKQPMGARCLDELPDVA